MSNKILKTIQIKWKWHGDLYCLKGFNICLMPSGKNPVDNPDSIVAFNNVLPNAQTVNNEYVFSYNFTNQLLNEGATYVPWVQALYENSDSQWASMNGQVIEDDGNATIVVIGNPTFQQIVDMASDNKITPQEKVQLKKEWEEVVTEHQQIQIGVIKANILNTTEVNNYVTAVNALGKYLNYNTTYNFTEIMSSTFTYPKMLTDNKTTNLDAEHYGGKANYNKIWRTYYEARITILEKIRDQLFENNKAEIDEWLGQNTLPDTIALGGYISSKLTPNMNWANTKTNGMIKVNNGTFVSTTGIKFTVTGDCAIRTGLDSNKGRSVYILFIGSNSSRFSFVSNNDSKQFICAVHDKDNWYYYKEGQKISFKPNTEDCIVAKVDEYTSTETTTGIKAIKLFASNGDSIFNALTNGGAEQGIYKDPETGLIFVNAEYVATGKLKSVNNVSEFDLDNGTFRLGGTGDTNYRMKFDGKDLYFANGAIKWENLDSNAQESLRNVTVTVVGGIRSVVVSASNVIQTSPTAYTAKVLLGTEDITKSCTFSWAASGIYTGSGTASTFTPSKGTYSTNESYVEVTATYKGNQFKERIGIAVSKLGTDGKGIKSTNITYQAGSNGTTPPSGTWEASVPSVSAGQYLWTRVIVTYTDTTTTTSYSVGKMGEKGPIGSTGATGTGIESITELYKMLTTKAQQPTPTSDSGWSTTPPAWTYGSYVHTCFKIVYKNPASTVYTKPVCDSSWEAVNEIQIGGRNLIQINSIAKSDTSGTYDKATNTWSLTSTSGVGTTWGAGLKITGNKTKVSYGQNYICSFEIKVPVACTWNVDVNNYASSGTSWSGNDNDLSSKRKTSSKSLTANVWTKCWFSYENSHTSNTNKVDIYDNSLFGIINNTGSAIAFQIRNVKGEIGNKPTDWTPAPEDVQAEISDVSNALSSLDKGVKDAFGDNIINDAEARAIASNIQILNNEKSDVDKEYSTINNNAKLAGTAKTNLTSAKSAYDSAHTSLISGINTAIADKKITDAERSSVDSFFSTYRTKLSDYKQRVQEALDYISTKKVDDISLGGRNLLLKSGVSVTNNSYGAATYYPSEMLTSGETYTVSICVTPASKVTHFSPYLSGGYAQQCTLSVSGTSKQIVSATFKATYASGRVPTSATDGNAAMCFYRFPNNSTVTTNSTIHWVKVEKGNKASDWTPAPEDIEKEIGDVSSALGTLDKGIKDAFGDSIINDAEARAIASNIQVLENEKYDIDYEYNALYNNAKLAGTAKTNLYSAKMMYNNAHSYLLLSINTAISDKKVTDDERVSVNSNFESYRNFLAAYKQRVQEALDYISTKKIDDLDIGGRNLISSSNKFNKGSCASGITSVVNSDGTLSVTSTSGNGNWFTGWAPSYGVCEANMNEGDVFTISFTMKSSNTTAIPTVYVKSGMGYYAMKGTMSSNWSTVYYTSTWKKANSMALHLGFSGIVGKIDIKNWKIEKGHKPTDWCLSLEETVSSVVQMYYQSTSPTNQNGGSWKTSLPPVKANYYIWTKTVTTYVAGNTSETTPILYQPDWIQEWGGTQTAINGTSVLSPKIFAGTKETNGTVTGVALGTNIFGTGSGFSGLAGYKKGVKTFHLSTTGDFTIGANTNNNHISFDGSNLSIKASSVKIGSSSAATTTDLDNKIDAIKIGSRNLLTNSKTRTTPVYGADGDNYTYFDDSTCYLKAGVTYMVTGQCPSGLTWSNVHGTTSSNNALLWLKSADNSHYIIISDAKTGTTGTMFTVPSTQTYTLRTNVYKKGQYTFSYIQIEEGNKATGWNPAPEDIDSEISYVKQQISPESIETVVGQKFPNKTEVSSQIKQSADSFELRFHQSGGVNLLRNSAFKNGQANWYSTRWDWAAGGTEYIEVVYPQYNEWTPANRNSLGACITGLDSSKAGQYIRSGFDSHQFDIKPNTTYTLNCLMACHRARSWTIEMLCYDANGTRITDSNHAVTIQNENHFGGRDRNCWKKIKHTWTTQSNAVTCHLRAFMNEWDGTHSTAYMWICEPIVTEGNLEVPWTPNSDELYAGITTIDKDGVRVQHGSGSYSHLSSRELFQTNESGNRSISIRYGAARMYQFSEGGNNASGYLGAISSTYTPAYGKYGVTVFGSAHSAYTSFGFSESLEDNQHTGIYTWLRCLHYPLPASNMSHAGIYSYKPFVFKEYSYYYYRPTMYYGTWFAYDGRSDLNDEMSFITTSANASPGTRYLCVYGADGIELGVQNGGQFVGHRMVEDWSAAKLNHNAWGDWNFNGWSLNNARVTYSLSNPTAKLGDRERLFTRDSHAVMSTTQLIQERGEDSTLDGQCIVEIPDDIKYNISKYDVNIIKYGPGDIWVSKREYDYFIVESDNDIKFTWVLEGQLIDSKTRAVTPYQHEADEKAACTDIVDDVSSIPASKYSIMDDEQIEAYNTIEELKQQNSLWKLYKR